MVQKDSAWEVDLEKYGDKKSWKKKIGKTDRSKEESAKSSQSYLFISLNKSV